MLLQTVIPRSMDILFLTIHAGSEIHPVGRVERIHTYYSPFADIFLHIRRHPRDFQTNSILLWTPQPLAVSDIVHCWQTGAMASQAPHTIHSSRLIQLEIDSSDHTTCFYSSSIPCQGFSVNAKVVSCSYPGNSNWSSSA